MNPTALMRWVRWCEANPERWAAGDFEIPLDYVDLTFDEVDRIFDQPTLADVVQAADEAIRNPADITAFLA